MIADFISALVGFILLGLLGSMAILILSGCNDPAEDVADRIKDEILEEVSEMTTQKVRRWPTNIIKFTTDDRMSLELYTRVKRAMEILGQNSNIGFEEVSTNHMPVLEIKVHYTPEPSNASIGFKGVHGSYMSLNQDASVNEIIHELFHVLGFRHEHQRPDRDSYVIVNQENVKKFQLHNFKRYYDQLYPLDMFPYDFESIMHYDSDDFSIGANKPTITKVDGTWLALGIYPPSQLDWMKLNYAYPAEERSSAIFEIDLEEITNMEKKEDMEDMDFRVGDKVFFDGHEGVVVSISADPTYPIKVILCDIQASVTFTRSGLHFTSDVHRRLFHDDKRELKGLLERHESKPVRKVKRYVNLYNRPIIGITTDSKIYCTPEAAKDVAFSSAVAVAVEVDLDEKYA